MKRRVIGERSTTQETFVMHGETNQGRPRRLRVTYTTLDRQEGREGRDQLAVMLRLVSRRAGEPGEGF